MSIIMVLNEKEAIMSAKQSKLTIKNQIGIIEMSRPPVNALGETLRNEIKSHIEACELNPAVKAIILASSESIFSAGADIKEFKTGFKGASLASIQTALEQSKKITIALINKQSLGGASEIAIACHYRVCDENATIGFPEVSLGLIPGAGGTQRLPRLVGFETALEMMLTGKPIPAKRALGEGLVDLIVTDKDLMAGCIDYAEKLINDAALVRPTCDNEVNANTNDVNHWAAVAKPLIQKSSSSVGPTAPGACYEALTNALSKPFDEGLALEQELFFKAILSQESQALQYAFFSQRLASKEMDELNTNHLTLPDQVGVIGAGLMGTGIAMVMANAGIEVVLVDMNQPNLDKGLAQIKQIYEASVKRGKLSQVAASDCLARISSTTQIINVAECDLIIEAVFEDMALKKQIFTELNQLCPKQTILATNTSALDVNDIASVVTNPERVIGLHFFSPAQVTKLLEIVRTDHTSDEVLSLMLALAKKIKKTPVVVGVCPGFVGNRLMFKYLKQANDMIMSGIKPSDVDDVLRQFGFPMGPFLMCDMVGLDLGWHMHDEPKEPRDVLCLAGRLGQKTKAGFYDYPESIKQPVKSDVADTMIADFAKSIGHEKYDITEKEILDRCLYAMINEGFKVLEEGIVKKPSDIDVIYLFGYGFPPYRGGPMYYAEQVGLNRVLETVESFHARYGQFWKPAPLLKQMVESNTKLKDWAKAKVK